MLFCDICQNLTNKKISPYKIGDTIINAILHNYISNKQIYREPHKIKLFKNRELKKIIRNLEVLLDYKTSYEEYNDKYYNNELINNLRTKFPKYINNISSAFDALTFLVKERVGYEDINNFFYQNFIELRKTNMLPKKRNINLEYNYLLNRLKNSLEANYNAVFSNRIF